MPSHVPRLAVISLHRLGQAGQISSSPRGTSGTYDVKSAQAFGFRQLRVDRPIPLVSGFDRRLL